MPGIKNVLGALRRARVAVVGDFALDAYWFLDPDWRETSIETGKPVWRVEKQRVGLGGAANVCANLAALGVESVAAIGLCGRDLFGRELRALMDARGIQTGDFVERLDWHTSVYAKPHRGWDEQSRIDFGTFHRLPDEVADEIAKTLVRATARCDLLIVNQQIEFGLVTNGLIERIHDVIDHKRDCKVLIDARHRANAFRSGMLKLNDDEAWRLRRDWFEERSGEATIERVALDLHEKLRQPVFVTTGSQGIVVADDGAVATVPAVPAPGEIDAVGAGDTVVASLAAGLASGVDAITCAKLAMLAAGVTVRKLHKTGTASPVEIRWLAEQCDAFDG